MRRRRPYDLVEVLARLDQIFGVPITDSAVDDRGRLLLASSFAPHGLGRFDVEHLVRHRKRVARADGERRDGDPAPARLRVLHHA